MEIGQGDKISSVTNKIEIPLLGIIYLVSVAIVSLQHFSKLDFGIVGILSWIIVIVGAIGFVVYILLGLFNQW